ncbi:hypothetical protein [Luteimonas sp. J29]|jgi:hypothetical protein|uniref:hypothetical protein n=1 Tax=Luteimonas sp. J29 TaxID=935863 RepID=UPI0004BCBAA9|nr:hypothetical protein [Luteimonas sp. J29]
MPARILTLLLLALCAWPAQARTATARIGSLEVAGAELDGVVVRLSWPAGAAHGELSIQAARIAAPALGPEYRQVRWRCPLSHDGAGAWHCAGPLQGRGGARMHLSVDLSSVCTGARLSQGNARLQLRREAVAPDVTRLDLVRVPLLWAQALLQRAWTQASVGDGVADGTIVVHTPPRQPLHVEGRLDVDGLALDTTDAAVAVAGLDGAIGFDWLQPDTGPARIVASGEVRDGEVLVGNTYVAIAGRPAGFALEARQQADGGWRLPRLALRDGDALQVEGDASFAADASLRALSLQARSARLAALPERYLSGWLGLAGLSGLELDGAADATLQVSGGMLQALDARLHDVSMRDPRDRLRIEGLAGELRHRARGAAQGRLSWREGALYGLAFGAIELPLASRDGVLRLRAPASLPMLGGELRLLDFALDPGGAEGLRLGFGLELDGLDVGQLSAALGWPAFRGSLDGRIPQARYASQRLDFDGGLSMRVFDGRVDVSALSMERPFGVAPTLSADLSLHGLDLEGLTGAFDFGSITGRLHGRIDGLRLVDWTATAFDAWLHTEPAPGVRQRISQRAVQDISSVGDASFVGSLQGRLVALFDDFGYRRIGIGCRLANEVCRMSGLHSAGAGFTIVEGSGVPRLQVVGFNRNVDWPTLVERLAAAAAGDVAPVVD